MAAARPMVEQLIKETYDDYERWCDRHYLPVASIRLRIVEGSDALRPLGRILQYFEKYLIYRSALRYSVWACVQIIDSFGKRQTKVFSVQASNCLMNTIQTSSDIPAPATRQAGKHKENSGDSGTIGE